MNLGTFINSSDVKSSSLCPRANTDFIYFICCLAPIDNQIFIDIK